MGFCDWTWRLLIVDGLLCLGLDLEIVYFVLVLVFVVGVLCLELELLIVDGLLCLGLDLEIVELLHWLDLDLEIEIQPYNFNKIHIYLWRLASDSTP